MPTIVLTEFGEPQRLPDDLPIDELKHSLRQAWQNRRWLHDYPPDPSESETEQPFVRFDGQWVQARNYAGTVSVGPHTICLLPKLFAKEPPAHQVRRAFAHLAFYLSYCRRVRFPFLWNESSTLADPLADWIRLFVAVTVPLLTRRPYLDYQSEIVETAYLRGKLAVKDYVRDQLARGQWQRLHTEQAPFTLDNPFNRIVKCTAVRLHALARTAERQLLQPILHALADVPLVPCTPTDCDAVHLNRLYETHQRVLSICRFFLAGTAAGPGADRLPHFAFLVPMERVFEDFVAGFIARHFPQWEAEFQQSVAWATDDRGQPLAVRPDIWLPHHRTVWDTKYKLLDTNGSPVADLYQMAAYCQARQVKDAHLLYVATEPKPTQVLPIRHTPLRVHVHSLPVVAPEQTEGFGVLTENLEEQLRGISKAS